MFVYFFFLKCFLSLFFHSAEAKCFSFRLPLLNRLAGGAFYLIGKARCGRKEGRKEEKVWPLSFLPCLQGKERIKGEGLSPAQVSVSIEKGASFGGGGGKRGRKKGSAPPGE